MPILAITGAGQRGAFRVENNIAGYNAYVGQDGLPDLEAPPAVFSATLPMNIPLASPPTGTRTYHILIRKQDIYGLESQNQYYKTITINSTGGLVLPPIPAPQNLRVYEQPEQMAQVSAIYPTTDRDEYPATHWRIWAKVTPPVITSEAPTVVVPVTGGVLSTIIGPLTLGLWYVAVALYRSDDNSQSPGLLGSVVIHTTPLDIVPVASGDEL